MIITLSGEGEDARQAFAALAEAMLARLVAADLVQAREVREVRAHGSSLASLLERFLEECLYVVEVEGFADGPVDIQVWSAQPQPGSEPLRLHARIHGEPLDEGRHRPGPRLSVRSGTAQVIQRDGQPALASVHLDEGCS